MLSMYTQKPTVVMKTTHYQATVQQCGNSKGITASGVKVQPGVCAVDKRKYKLGTVFYGLDNREVLVAADTGSGVKGNHVDIYTWDRRPRPTGKLRYVIVDAPSRGLSSRKIQDRLNRREEIKKRFIR